MHTPKRDEFCFQSRIFFSLHDNNRLQRRRRLGLCSSSCFVRPKHLMASRWAQSFLFFVRFSFFSVPLKKRRRRTGKKCVRGKIVAQLDCSSCKQIVHRFSHQLAFGGCACCEQGRRRRRTTRKLSIVPPFRTFPLCSCALVLLLLYPYGQHILWPEGLFNSRFSVSTTEQKCCSLKRAKRFDCFSEVILFLLSIERGEKFFNFIPAWNRGQEKKGKGKNVSVLTQARSTTRTTRTFPSPQRECVYLLCNLFSVQRMVYAIQFWIFFFFSLLRFFLEKKEKKMGNLKLFLQSNRVVQPVLWWREMVLAFLFASSLARSFACCFKLGLNFGKKFLEFCVSFFFSSTHFFCACKHDSPFLVSVKSIAAKPSQVVVWAINKWIWVWTGKNMNFMQAFSVVFETAALAELNEWIHSRCVIMMMMMKVIHSNHHSIKIRVCGGRARFSWPVKVCSIVVQREFPYSRFLFLANQKSCFSRLQIPGFPFQSDLFSRVRQKREISFCDFQSSRLRWKDTKIYWKFSLLAWLCNYCNNNFLILFGSSAAAAFEQKSNSISWNKTLESLLFFAEFVCMFFCCSRLTFSTRRITAEQNWKQSKVEAKAKKKQAKNKKEILLFVFQKVVWRVTKRSSSKRNDEELSKK